jgi:DNA/RNA-binding domain of Phe-tRNA-synthetase-like protein
VIDPRVLDRFPGLTVLVLVGRDVAGGPSTESSVAALREAARIQRDAFDGSPPTAHAHIAVWRSAYSRFGAKPSRYPCSAEALLKRALRGDELPAVNRLVDAYNAVSVRWVVPVGGEDADRIRGTSRLTFAASVASAASPAAADAAPDPGEVVWADDQGITCRRWNWRQEPRTALTEGTRNAVFVLEALAPYPRESLVAAGQDLAGLLLGAAPEASVDAWLLPTSERIPVPEGT